MKKRTDLTLAKRRDAQTSIPAPVRDDETGRRPESLAAAAYDRIEELIVHFRLPPGADIRMSELQAMIQIGRTPVHQAVRRLADETLIQIRPRDGLRISPIDLMRDRRLLGLRKDMDRFVVRLAAEKLSGNQRNQLLGLGRQMQSRREIMDVAEFNQYDRLLDRVTLDAAAEPFLEQTLRPLHTIFRRIGWLYHSEIGTKTDLLSTIDHHLEVLSAMSRRDAAAVMAASDRLIDYADGMFDSLETRIDPSRLDVGSPAIMPSLAGARR